jgi:hypothetical protein
MPRNGAEAGAAPPAKPTPPLPALRPKPPKDGPKDGRVTLAKEIR